MLGKDVILPFEISTGKRLPFVGVGKIIFVGSSSSESTESAYSALVMGVLPPDSKE